MHRCDIVLTVAESDEERTSLSRATILSLSSLDITAIPYVPSICHNASMNGVFEISVECFFDQVER